MAISRQELQARRAIMALNTPGRRLRRKPPRPLLPRGPRMRYQRALVELTTEAQQILEELLLPELPRLQAEAAILRSDSWRQDQVDQEIERIIAQIRIRFADRFSERRARDVARTLASDVNTFSERDVSRGVRSVLGIELGDEPSIAPHLDEFVRENVRLIKSIPDNLLSEIEGIISRGVRRGRPSGVMAEEIQRRFRVTENRAKLIARDQVGKLNGELTQLRQTALGVRRYRWRTSRDSDVRKEHRQRDGEIFEWANPPPDGHPGEPVNCRCTAEPVLDDILAEL